jgi:hypothetical protein
MGDVTTIEEKYQALSGRLDEATRRLWAATEARSLGRGGVSLVAKAVGMSRTTIHAGLAELKSGPAASDPAHDARLRCRTAGGGRSRLAEKDAGLLHDLDALVEPASRGDPMSPLRWTCKSTYRLAEELRRQGHVVCQRTICDLLGQMGFSLQPARKTREGPPACGPGCPVRAYCPRRGRLPGRWRSGRFGRHQEEGTDLATSRMPARNGSPREARKKSGSMTSSTRRWARLPLMASMTWPRTRAG